MQTVITLLLLPLSMERKQSGSKVNALAQIKTMLLFWLCFKGHRALMGIIQYSFKAACKPTVTFRAMYTWQGLLSAVSLIFLVLF